MKLKSVLGLLFCQMCLFSCWSEYSKGEKDQLSYDKGTKEFIRTRRWNWKNFRFENPTLFTFSPVLRSDGRSSGRCWYKVSDTLETHSSKFVMHFFSNAELITKDGTVSDESIMARSRRNQLLHSVAMGLELATGKAACSEAVIGVVAMTTFPALSTALTLPTAGAILACTLTGVGLLEANAGINRNQEIQTTTGSLSHENNLEVKKIGARALSSLEEVVSNLYNSGNYKTAYCPTPTDLVKVFSLY